MTAPASEAPRAPDMPRIALIHATRLAIDPIEEAFRAHWPEAPRFHLLEEALSRDRQAAPAGAAPFEERFTALSRYARLAGAGAILYTCSAFGREIEAARRAVPLPTFKPNEAMFAEALGRGRRIALVATFQPSLATMRAELEAAAAEHGIAIKVEPVFVPGAMDALDRGDAAAHDHAIAAAARSLVSIDVLLLAQFSMARARATVAEMVAVPVLTSPESAVAALRRAVSPGRP